MTILGNCDDDYHRIHPLDYNKNDNNDERKIELILDEIGKNNDYRKEVMIWTFIFSLMFVYLFITQYLK